MSDLQNEFIHDSSLIRKLSFHISALLNIALITYTPFENAGVARSGISIQYLLLEYLTIGELSQLAKTFRSLFDIAHNQC